MAASVSAGARGVPSAQSASRVAFWPLVAFPRGPSAQSALPEVSRLAERHLPRAGAILFRGFGIDEDAALERFVAAAALPLVGQCTPESRLWLWCAEAPRAEEHVQLVDCGELYQRLPARVVQRWSERGIEYSRRFEPPALRRWLAASGRAPAELSSFCREHRLRCEWEPRGAVRLSRSCSPVARHPHTGALVWSAPAASVPMPLGASVGSLDSETWRWRHADGTPLDPLEACEVAAAVESSTLRLRAEAGDVLLLDTWRLAHVLVQGSADRFVTLCAQRRAA